jgi:hypothetical protein
MTSYVLPVVIEPDGDAWRAFTARQIIRARLRIL